MRRGIKKPIISEKSMGLASKGWYTFRGSPGLSKSEAAGEIEKIYGVTVIDVRSLKVLGKERKVGRKGMKVTGPDWKKFFIRLKEGESLEAFQAAQDEVKT
jgi:large subunit ribosomal protein L23